MWARARVCVHVCVCVCVCVCAMYVLCSVDPISSLQSVLWFNIGSVESFERSLENAQVEMNVEPANYVSVIYKTETEMWDPVQFFSKVVPCYVFFAWWTVGILDLLGCSGRVVWLWSFDFYPASLKSLGCFYYRCVLSSHWKLITVNSRSLQCQLSRHFWRSIVSVSGNKQKLVVRAIGCPKKCILSTHWRFCQPENAAKKDTWFHPPSPFPRNSCKRNSNGLCTVLQYSNFNFRCKFVIHSLLRNRPGSGAATSRDFLRERLQRAFTLANQLRWIAQ